MRATIPIMMIMMVAVSMCQAELIQRPTFLSGHVDDCPEVNGTSTKDRFGCLDSDGDGWSDPDSNWTIADGADRYHNFTRVLEAIDEVGSFILLNNTTAAEIASDSWSDSDGDGWADQAGTLLTDDCPNSPGTSRIMLFGCSDIDGDWIPDWLDPDADGDLISNDAEFASSGQLKKYDPLDPDDYPPDSDHDTIPDNLDSDDDNDGWPDGLEIDRGSDPYDEDETPFMTYFGVQTGVFYTGGLDFQTEYRDDAVELSLSGFISIATGEMVIPLSLVPIYLLIFRVRKRIFNNLSERIGEAEDIEVLKDLEDELNELVRSRKLRVYHGLVLRNELEVRENELGIGSLDVTYSWVKAMNLVNHEEE